MDEKCLHCPVKETTDRHTNDIRTIFETIKVIEVTAADKNARTETLLEKMCNTLESIESKLDKQNEVFSEKFESFRKEVEAKLAERDKEIEDLKMAPARKWDKVSTQVIISFIGMIFSFLAGKFLK